MVLLVPIFLLGIANFELHAAVLASRHPMIEGAGFSRRRRGRVTLTVEFLVLTAALAFASRGTLAILWVYGIYTAINAVAAWLIVSRRV